MLVGVQQRFVDLILLLFMLESYLRIAHSQHLLGARPAMRAGEQSRALRTLIAAAIYKALS